MEEEEWWKAQPSRPTVTKRSPLLLLSPLVRERGGKAGPAAYLAPVQV